MPIKDSFLPEFDQEMKTTRTVLERCPEAEFSFKPHAKSWTMAQLATHLANLPSWVPMTLKQTELDVAPVGAPPYKEEPVKSSAELLAKFDNNITQARSAFEETSDEEFGKTWTLLMGGQVILAMPRTACIRSFVINHVVHHRAQLTVYLRLNDIPVPSIYGPSADEG